MLGHVGLDWFGVNSENARVEFIEADYWHLMDDDSISGASRYILNLYDHIRRFKNDSPLFTRYASEVIHPPEPCRPLGSEFSERLAHSSNLFPLADAQRDAIAHLLHVMETGSGEILGVNGPPGTGKTTMLLSVVATLWTKFALADAAPPVIVAASTNNQAVTNIIDAFGKDFCVGTGVFAGRWIPDIASFGAYLPSAAKESLMASKYQTRSFFEKLETVEFVIKAQHAYLDAAQRAFPSIENLTLEACRRALNNAIRDEQKKLKVIESAWCGLMSARAAVKAHLGDDPTAEFARRQDKEAIALEMLAAAKKIADDWDTYLTNESIIYALFSWLPPVAIKRLRLARRYMAQLWPANIPPEELRVFNEIEANIIQRKNQFEQAAQLHQSEVEAARSLLENENACLAQWSRAVELVSILGNPNTITLAECDRAADVTIRFHIFLLTTHYWEARWLIEMNDIVADMAKENKKTGAVAIEKKWRRRAKLTPCVVSTFFMLPKEMEVKRYDDGAFVSEYLYNFADLLIVDEAGQVLPEVAGASFSLSKAALVIGDTLQIEPIWAIPKHVDIGNLVTAEIIPSAYNHQAYERTSDLGKTAASGSVMRIAQHASRYHYDRDLPRGMFLYEHRRCYDSIARYCDELCYRNKLELKRGESVNANQLRAMGYLHVDGICETIRGGSRQNVLEAETIAAWIAAHKSQLESFYEKPLHAIVAVVTPFGGQVNAISRACQKHEIAVGSQDNQMTVGTVHSMQGAERPVVIFSPVYSKHADGGFIDKSPSMLNVAVSRAKDSFLLFGDMSVFDLCPSSTPRGLLASHLLRSADNALSFTLQHRADLKTQRNQFMLLEYAAQHDAFLLDVLTRAQSEIHIVTPWIKRQCVVEVGALDAMAAAVQRGVKVNVYTDYELNTNANEVETVVTRQRNLSETRAALQENGIRLAMVKKVHSKIVIADNDLYCVGSFNWFSAARTGAYKRHETSLVYQGPDVANEIKVSLQSLQQHCIE